MTDLYQELYDESTELKALYAGELAGMAFVAHHLLMAAQSGSLDNTIIISSMEKALTEYYTGLGKNGIYASAYMKEEV